MSLPQNVSHRRNRGRSASDRLGAAASYARNAPRLGQAPATQNLAHDLRLDSKTRRDKQGVLSERMALPNLHAIGKRQDGLAPRDLTPTVTSRFPCCHLAKSRQIDSMRQSGKRTLAAVPPVAERGGGGIRTHGTLERPTEPKSAALTAQPPRLRAGVSENSRNRVLRCSCTLSTLRILGDGRRFSGGRQVLLPRMGGCAPPSSCSQAHCFFGRSGYPARVGRGGAPLKKHWTLVQRSFLRSFPHPAGTS